MPEFINKVALGRNGEELVLQNYLERGYSLVQQNFQYYSHGQQGRKGEIDLIVKKDNLIVIVEVKTRNSYTFGQPVEQVSYGQIVRLRKTYDYFLLKFPEFRKFFARIDVGLVDNFKVTILENIG